MEMFYLLVKVTMENKGKNNRGKGKLLTGRGKEDIIWFSGCLQAMRRAGEREAAAGEEHRLRCGQ